MPSVRSLILIAISIAVLSLIAAWVNLFRTPDSNGMGRDSFGTREGGYRAVFETLDELGIDVKRQLRPPTPALNANSLVFLNPDPRLCGVEPVYLQELLPWVEAGGHLVIATRAPSLRELDMGSLSNEATKLPSIFDSLGMEDVSFESFGNDRLRDAQQPRREDLISDTVFEGFHRELDAPRIVKVMCSGTLAGWESAVQKLALPGDQEQAIHWETTEPVGRISHFTIDNKERVIAAEFSRGKGKILVAHEGIFRNRMIPKNDNSVVAAYLISPGGAPVVFDEFYHGLGVRGNPLYLLTQPGYAALALGLLLWIGLSSWRKATMLGPALFDEPQTRRDIGEYLSAMGQFFSKGRSSRPFLVQQIRQGVLRELNIAYALPPESHDVDLVASLIARKDPRRAQKVREAFHGADELTHSNGRLSEPQILEAMRRLTACL